MPCYSPAKIPHPEKRLRDSGVRLQIACGRCIGCLLQRGRDWTVRCLHEARLHESSLFLTLTYDDDHLFVPDAHPSLNPIDMTLFFKRLRKAGHRVRYFYCGEYGERTDRPHYHAIVFGLQLSDLKESFKRNGYKYFTSRFLDDVWKLGSVVVSDVTPDSVAYTAGYCLKKLYGPDATLWYAQRQTIPPFVRMSRRPGIGADYFSRYKMDMRNDYTMLSSTFKSKLPRFYDKLLKVSDSDDLERRKAARKDRAWSQLSEQSKRRLAQREAIARARFDQRPDRYY